jgi:hypothetical protein
MTVLSGRVVRLDSLYGSWMRSVCSTPSIWSKVSRVMRVRSPTSATTVRLSP